MHQLRAKGTRVERVGRQPSCLRLQREVGPGLAIMGLQHILLSIPQQLSGVVSAVPELMSFPPWQTAWALLRLRYVTRRWGWVGARPGE